MRIRDLGPLVVEVSGRAHSLGSTRQAAFLAILCARAGERVPTDELVDAVWGSDAEVSPSSVDNQLWRLRRLIEPERDPRGPARLLVNDAGGIRLQAPDGTLDSQLFTRAAVATRTHVVAGRFEAGIDSADHALALWRGRPFEILVDAPAVAPAVARLEELHVQLLELRVDALVAAGRWEAAVAESGALVREFPLRERFWAQRMTALASSGRTDEALTAYAAGRRTLLDEVGIEPGPELRRLQHQILNEDLPVRTSPVWSPAPARAVPRISLPERTTALIGREEDLTAVAELVHGGPLVSVVGPGGSGKTRLAIELGHRLRPRFPDSIYFVDLNAVLDQTLVVEAAISVIGLQAETAADSMATLATFARARRVLLIIDNCEHVLDAVAQVARALADEGGDCTVLATSREPLGVTGEQIWTLRPLSLASGTDAVGSPLASPAVQLFLERAQAAAPALTWQTPELRLAAGVCRAVDGLPLAIELAAARIRSFSLTEIWQQVSDDPGRLSRLGRGPEDHRRTIRATIDWSHRLLPPAEQLVHRRLCVLPGEFTRSAARAVSAGPGVDEIDVDDLLALLVHRSMLTSRLPAHRGRPTTYAQLAAVRAHAALQLDDAGETRDVVAARDGWVARLLSARPPLGRPEEATWNDRVEDDYPAIRAALARRHDPVALRQLARLIHFWYYRSRMVEGCRLLEEAVRSSTDPDAPELVLARTALCAALFLSGRVDEGIAQSVGVLDSADVTAELRREFGETLAGAIKGAWSRNQYDVVRALHERLDAVADAAADDNLRLIADALSGAALLGRPDLAPAAKRSEEVHQRAREAGNLEALWCTAGVRHVVALVQADPVSGFIWADRLIANHLPLGTGGTGVQLEGLANFTAMQQRPVEALRLYAASQAQTLAVGMIWPRQPLSADLLRRTRESVEDGVARRAWDEGATLTIVDVAAERGLTPGG